MAPALNRATHAPAPTDYVRRILESALPAPRVLYVAVVRPSAFKTLARRDKAVYAALLKSDYGALTPGELREAVGVTRNAISGSVWRLRQAGLLRRVPIKLSKPLKAKRGSH